MSLHLPPALAVINDVPDHIKTIDPEVLREVTLGPAA